MNNPNPPVPSIEQVVTPAPPATAPPVTSASATTFTVGSTVVQPSSAEIAFPLREEQFLMLCEGESSTDRSGRDLSIGLFCGALVGIAGVLAAVDWNFVWKPEHRTLFILSSVILSLVTSGSLVGIIICWLRLRRNRNDSSYSRLKRRIDDFFKSIAT